MIWVVTTIKYTDWIYILGKLLKTLQNIAFAIYFNKTDILLIFWEEDNSVYLKFHQDPKCITTNKWMHAVASYYLELKVPFNAKFY